MALDKYTQLKIASNVLNQTLSEMAEAWDVTVQTVRGVAMGNITSERILKNIDDKIDEAEEVYNDHKKQKATA